METEARDATWYLRYLADTIHRTVMATVDDEGHPSTAAIDMIDADETGPYFLTARGKGLYRRLSANPWIAATGMIGEETMSTVAVSVRGRVEELGTEPLGRLFDKNPFMRINLSDGVARIRPENCLRCGRCLEVCPADAVACG